MGRAIQRLDAFADIPNLSEGSRRDAWRHAMAQLASHTADHVPVPLEGMDVSRIEQGVRWALSEGLFDELGWLLPQHGAVALYELAGALRPGPERRELGRRALERLMQGNATTFAALARRIALGSRRGLSGHGVAPRVCLVLDLPDGVASESEEDGLALSLLTHPDLLRKWAVDPATGSLPSRRLAARLLERAACEAIRRSTDRHGYIMTLFERPDIQRTWTCLLMDREPLVWRHVASARGLLSQKIPMLDGEIVRDLDPGLSPTEWRRAAASAAAAVAVDPELTLARCKVILSGKAFEKDPGIAGAMAMGLSRGVRAEPQAVETILEMLVPVGGVDVIEAIVQLRHEHIRANVGAKAVIEARRRLANNDYAVPDDPGRAALLRALDRELEATGAAVVAAPTLVTHLRMAQEAFAFEGASAAGVWARGALAEAEMLVDRLESCNDDIPEGREESFFILRQIDGVLLERSTLADMLSLGIDSKGTLARLEMEHERIAKWLLSVALPAGSDSSEQSSSGTYEMHRLRAMLHLVDSNAIVTGVYSIEQKDRKLRMARWLLDRVSSDAPPALRRVLAASAARACDALLREEIGELSDVLIMVGDRVRDPTEVLMMAEAAADPAMVQALKGYSMFLRACQRPVTSEGNLFAALDALDELLKGLPVLGTPRVEALRSAVVAYASTLETLMSVRCLAQVAGAEGAVRPCIPPLANIVGWLTRLATGARRRMDGIDGVDAPRSEDALRKIDVGVEHALRGSADPLFESVVEGLEVLRTALPLGLSGALDNAVERLLELPLQLPQEFRTDKPTGLTRPRPPAPLVLPAWMPANRVLGGFYVMRLLGHGGVGSVYVACRAEDRNRRRPTLFAMKIPEYGADVAHTLSEAAFFDLFRDEAGALLSIPRHPNLARFVTFDAGARPKPILVMELVEGPTLERLIGTRVLEMNQALAYLDGIAAGLEAMHALGIGHLDVKPSNVILRVPEDRVDLDIAFTSRASHANAATVSASEARPVLVDFGLAGRRLRPGCATAEYGAPEIWGYLQDNQEPPPMPADVYAFSCLVFETLTGETLFQGANNTAVIASHIKHDGDPQGFARLKGDPVLEELACVLSKGLRRSYRNRCTITEMRQGMAGLKLCSLKWPVR